MVRTQKIKKFEIRKLVCVCNYVCFCECMFMSAFVVTWKCENVRNIANKKREEMREIRKGYCCQQFKYVAKVPLWFLKLIGDV